MKYLFLPILLALSLSSCHHDHDHEGHHHHDEAASNPLAVHFSTDLQKHVDFAVDTVSMLPMGKVIRTVAQILPSQGDEVVLTARTDGMVRLGAMGLNEGQPVTNGQVVCQIDASRVGEGSLTVRQQQAKAEMERAQLDYERLQALRSENLALESELLAARAAFQQATAAFEALTRGFGEGTQPVTATQAGYVKSVMVQNGQFVTVGSPIAIIAQSRTLRLRADVQASYYKDLQYVCDASFRPLNSTEPYLTLSQVGGRLLSYGRQTSTANPLVPVTFEINNVVDLLPGTYVEMFLRTRAAQPRPCVPSTAIIEETGHFFVYLALPDDEHDLFLKQEVHIGQTDGLYTEVVGGLPADARVVSRGAMILRMHQATGSVDPHAGHSH